MALYVFSGKPLVVRQLQSISETFDGVTIERLTDIGIERDWHCLEIGAGNGSIASAMAELVGSSGHVLATDIELEHVQLDDLNNVEVRRHDIAHDHLPASAFDLIHARLVLMHLPDPRAVLVRLQEALKPRGWLLVEDYDVSPNRVPSALSAPDVDAAALYDKAISGLSRVTAAAGLDLGWGTHANSVMRDVGYIGVRSETFARSASVGLPGYDLIAVYVQQLRDPILASGALTELEMDDFIRLVEDPHFAYETPLLVSTWGQRPSR